MPKLIEIITKEQKDDFIQNTDDWNTGTNQDKSSAILKTLNKMEQNYVYFMHIGKHQAAGHYQILYYNKKQWKVRTSEKNHNDITDKNGKLTNEAKLMLILLFETDKTLFTIIKIDEHIMEELAEYIIDERINK